MALDRLPAGSPHPIGSLLLNPGGPGVSGVSFLPQIASLITPSVRQHFDLIGFDPPGVGGSDPVICGDGKQLDRWYSADPDPQTAAGFAALVRTNKAFARGCERRSGRILPYVSTADAARDMEFLRVALHDGKLNYLGFSYGTFLGATYASLFPRDIRTMVLDGALDPALGPLQLVEQQSASLEREFNSFVARCKASLSCAWTNGKSGSSAFAGLLAKVRRHPISVPGLGQKVGPAALLYGTGGALYSPESWPELASALELLKQGQAEPMLQLFDNYVGRAPNGTYSNELEAENAVNCLDAAGPSFASIKAAAPATLRAARFFGLLDLYSESSCTVWPVRATSRPRPISAKGSPPIVVVGSTFDPVTPYAWAGALASQLSRGVLLTRVGYGHTGYEFSSCVRRLVGKYLVDRVPPRRGTVCKSD